MHRTSDNQQWKKAVESGLLPHVVNLDELQRLVQEDYFRAIAVMGEWLHAPSLLWQARGIAVAHEMIFGRVHPWAGKFRRSGQVACIHGHVGADPAIIFFREETRAVHSTSLLLIELERLERQSAWMRRNLGTSQFAALVAASVFHLRFLRIHPFLDGNGRTGRLLLLLQLLAAGMKASLVGLQAFGDKNRAVYIEALQAGDRGEMAPLINWCASLCEVRFANSLTSFRSPYYIPPEMETEKPLSPHDLRWKTPVGLWMEQFRSALGPSSRIRQLIPQP